MHPEEAYMHDEERKRAREAQARLFPVANFAATLPAICQRVATALKRSDREDALPTEELKEIREMLLARVEHWDNPQGCSGYDSHVKAGCQMVADMILQELWERQHRDRLAKADDGETGYH